jgi:glutamate/tyrosine decarboxylase-like PLP-dependent enzyme
MAAQAAEVVARYYAEVSDLPLMPATSAEAVHEALAETLPRSGVPFEQALAVVRDVVYPLCRHNAHPRFFGYVASPGTPVAAAGDLLTAGLNANVTSWRSSPAAAEMEHVVLGWLKSMLGYPEAAGGVLVSGGSMANLSAMAAMRTAKAPEAGRSGYAARLRVYVSEEGHFSIHKAARMLGIGSENVRVVATDEALRMDLADLQCAIDEDRRAGLTPACVVANAGSANSGAFDPLAEIAAIAERERLWFHVDGAYGAFAALAESTRPMFVGIERADSVTLDPHKWLYVSNGCGCILYRDPAMARATFSHDADYVRTVGFAGDEAFAFWDYSPELSRPFRALGLWLQFKVYGADALGRAIARNIACAQYFGRLVEQSSDFELLAPVGLSIFCFRYRPAGFPGDLNSLNERTLARVQRSGTSYLSSAGIRGRFALRGCVLNYRTMERDMELLLEDVRTGALHCSACPDPPR